MFIAESAIENIFKISDYLAKLQARTWLSRALSPSFSSVLAKRVCEFAPSVPLHAEESAVGVDPVPCSLAWTTDMKISKQLVTPSQKRPGPHR